MALQVWLPLNGDLHNQGLTNVTVINNGAIVDNNGKIGKCYSFNGNNINYSNFNASGLSEISVCCWAYPTGTNLKNLFGINIGTNWQFTITGDSQIGVRDDQNSTRKDYSIGTITANTWIHLCCTYKNGEVKIYKNGSLFSTNNTGGTKLNAGINNYHIGMSQSGSTYSGKINDFRVYDHCLSAKEVEEIAKGLVLHYQLNDPYIESTTNLFKPKPCTGGGNWIASGNGVKIDWAANAKDTYWYLQLADGVTLVQGDTYTFSCRCSGIGSTTVMFRWCNLAGYDIYLHNGWNQYTFSMPSRNITHPFLDDIDRDASLSNLQIYDFQLEKKGYATPYTSSTRNLNIIYDSSGYNNNGIATGILTISSITPRYEYAIKYPDSACAIGIGNLFTMVPEGIFTFNIWFKKNTGEWSSKTWETILGGPSGFEFEGKLSGSTNAYIHPYSWGGGSTSTPNSYSIAYTLDEWHMITMVRTTSNTKFYLDGEFKVTGSAGSIPSGDYFIGAWKTATSQNYRGYFSDARIYATALSEDEIKKLYNTSMIIDNQGNTYARELVE